jgi:superfamily II DNA or RNA helicase
LARLLALDEVDSFNEIRRIRPDDITDDLVRAARALDEREEIEPFVRRILFDAGETPHGPAEIVDILTHKVRVDDSSRVAAIIIKGKSFPTVRPRHVSHQIYRLEKIDGLQLAGFFAAGTVLDAAKEQFISTAIRLSCDYLIADANDLARLFVAYGYLCPRDARQIRAGRCRCGYSPEKRLLNPLQAEALKALIESHRLSQAGGLVVLPPGGGKTRVAAEDAKQHGAERLLYVAHTHEILDVAESELAAVLGADAVKRCVEPRHLSDASSRARLATVQLLRRHLGEVRGEIDYLVVDEFHHAAARTYRELMATLQPGYLLGLTATPFRGDRQDIAELVGHNVIVSFELRTGIETGILTPYHYYGCFDDVDYTRIRHNGSRYDIRDLERALTIPERDNAIIAQWRERADQRATLAFCCSRLHAKRFAAALQAAGIPAETYLDETPMEVRRARQDALAAGDLKVLCTVDVLNEGADLPFVECLLFLRPTESIRIFYQQLGRGLRQHVGKAYCVVIDFIGNFKNAFRLPEYHRLLDVDEPEHDHGRPWTRKNLLNLPLGCEVVFDERVIDLFARQTLDPRFATRSNIGQILLYQYERLSRRLGHQPTKADVDRSCILDSTLYVLVFGSWAKFERLALEAPEPSGQA